MKCTNKHLFQVVTPIFHGGVLWLGKPLPVDIQLISTITGLPFTGVNPTPLLKKDQEATIATWMKKKYDVVRSKRGFLIHSINNPIVCFAAKVLASKLLRKMHPDQCTAGAILLAKLCAVGVQINWCQFLLDKLVQDTIDA